MNTGIIRRIDDLGRVVIPREIRRKLNIVEGDPLEISVDADTVSFTPYRADIKKQIDNVISTISVNESCDNYEEIQHNINQLKEIAETLERLGV